MHLIATDLRFHFSGRVIIDGIDLTVQTGETTAIVGPSGMGKTTLLALLGGLLEPSQGRVAVATAAPNSGAASPPAAYVSWVLQTTNVLPDRTALDNVALGAFGDGIDRPNATAIASERLARMGLRHRAADPARRLSGGELQRVVIARALSSQRPFILADEPTGQLDGSTTDIVIAALLSAAETKGVVVVTHDQTVARSCDRILELRDGRLGGR